MGMAYFVTLLMVSITFWTNGCASPSRSIEPTPVPIPDAMPSWKSERGLAVGVDPFVQADRQEAVFGVHFHDVGVVSLLVYVVNEGDQPLLIRYSDMLLELATGTQLGSMEASSVINKLEQVGTWSSLGPGVPFIPGGGSPSIVAGFGALSALGAIAAVSAEGAAIKRARAALKTEYQHKQLHDVTLGQNESAYGFVYFIPSAGIPAFSEATLKVWGVKTQESGSITVQVPLSKIDFTWSSGKRLHLPMQE